MRTSTKLGNILMSEKAKIMVQKIYHSVLVKPNYFKYSGMRYKLCFKG